MIISRLEFDRFRNLKKGEIAFDKGINVIYGENAQGKTNILEAIWLFTGAKSFRGAKDGELIQYDQKGAELKLDFFAEKRDQTATIRLGEKKDAELNGVKKGTPSKFGGVIKGVIFSPDHLSLIKDGPAERRAFLDLAINQLTPSYAALNNKYNRAVTQRNSVLKDMRFNAGLDSILDAYERQIALLGCKIIKFRKRYIELINRFAPEIYSGISGGKEKISIDYVTAADDEESLAEQLYLSRNEDILSGVTSVGPHRDDIEVLINGHSARRFGSQGQQRSCVLTLKLCEAAIIYDISGEQPIILLDDVMSELDEGRQDYVLNAIGERQVFITCCDKNSVSRLKEGKGIKVSDGNIVEG
ncbi:MAG: DNA replication/repair protein RecF [Acutalibacteraceae bacterium]|nr:DNA replication/repair protein RecF [Clostridia bacterium]MBQ2421287.1 DNA replication/repair protein RecF [Clostridia bacterium]MEE1127099.1 DNA replication/repair protein RecF [Acutalibacteraceae bacterium]